MIRSVGYDPTEQLLEIEFHHGRIYRYSSVPEFIYRGLMVSKSKGSFFNSRIVERYPGFEVSTAAGNPDDPQTRR